MACGLPLTPPGRTAAPSAREGRHPRTPPSPAKPCTRASALHHRPPARGLLPQPPPAGFGPPARAPVPSSSRRPRLLAAAAHGAQPEAAAGGGVHGEVAGGLAGVGVGRGGRCWAAVGGRPRRLSRCLPLTPGRGPCRHGCLPVPSPADTDVTAFADAPRCPAPPTSDSLPRTGLPRSHAGLAALQQPQLIVSSRPALAF
ncbi:hypothetical protein MC885_005310 [Smutsia gigantea]|nr:hypothetical protein MC885_005310 [Smutsia gigantea]